MTSVRKIAANRANACRSTGPRSIAGKARVSRNAFRHGLAIDIVSDPVFALEIDRLRKCLLANSSMSPEAAEEISRCECEVLRVRVIRRSLLDLLAVHTETVWFNPKEIVPDFLDDGFAELVSAASVSYHLPTRPDPERVAAALFRATKQLANLDRYERRALSRRRRAIRATLRGCTYVTTRQDR